MYSAFALICWKNKILLTLRDNIPTIPAPNCWTLPGGGVEKGETILQAIKRELMEEVSYFPKSLNYLGKTKSEDRNVHLFYSFIEDSEANKFHKGKFEGQKIGFFTLDEMEKIQLAPVINERLNKHRKSLENVLKKKSFEDFIF